MINKLNTQLKLAIALALLLLFCFFTGCSNDNIKSCINDDKEYGDWVKYGEGTATSDNQIIESYRGTEIVNEFSATITAEVTSAIKAELGYKFSVSSVTLTGTSKKIDSGQSIFFYYRSVYQNIIVTYTDGREEYVKVLLPPEYAWEIQDLQGNLIEDTRNNPIQQVESYPETDQTSVSKNNKNTSNKTDNTSNYTELSTLSPLSYHGAITFEKGVKDVWGHEYSDAIFANGLSSSYANGYVEYNLEKQFKEFICTYFIKEKYKNQCDDGGDGIIRVYGDNTLIHKTSRINSEKKLITFKLNVENVSVLKIEFVDSLSCGIGDMFLQN